MQKKAWMPLLISTDEEGGFVERIMNIYGHRPGALETYQTGKIENAAKLGHSISHDLQALGINTDLAPDVDVPVVMGPDQYMRTWGYTPQSVIQWGGTYLRAIQGDGEIGCLKHFPGLGAATTDAHSELPHPFVTDILRHQLGYNGVVLTDALYMLGIANKWNLTQAVVLAIEAGNDMILGVRDSSELSSSVAALKQAIAAGGLSMASINESVTRIIALKIQYHLWPSTPEL